MTFLSVLTLCLGDGFLAPVVDNARKYLECTPHAPREEPHAEREEYTPLTARRGLESTMADERVERQQTDAGLVRRWSAGGKEAFQELTERYYRPVCAFLW